MGRQAVGAESGMARGFGGIGWWWGLWREGEGERLAGPSGTRPWLKVMNGLEAADLANQLGVGL